MSEDNLHQIEELAEGYLRRQREGIAEPLDLLVNKHPEIAQELRDFIEALQLIDDLKASEASKVANHSLNAVGDQTAPTSLSHGEVCETAIEDYRIIRELGRGAMGVVYEAEQLSLSRRVALKTMLCTSDPDGTFEKRFEHEARTAGRLHHPRIVPVYDVGKSNGLHYYAMQFIEGCGLDQVAYAAAELLSDRPPSDSVEDNLARVLLSGGRDSSSAATDDLNPPQPERESDRDIQHIQTRKLSPGSSVFGESNHTRYFRAVAKLGQQIADALAFAHDEGVIHRDIKPANLLLDKNGAVWVADFGLVKTHDTAMTQTGAFVGTLRYMAPERFRGECSPLSDIYSLGVTLYELLAFRPAIDSSDKFSLISNIRDTDPPELRKIERRIPRDLEVIVSRAIHKEPKRRYQSARELADDLGRFLDGRPIHARSIGSIERGWIWSKRNPLPAALLGLLVAGVLATTVGSMVAAFQFREIATRERISKEEERKTLARSNFFLALSRWKESRALDAIRLIESVPEEYRDIEWYLTRRHFRGSYLSFYGHTALVRCAAFAPNGQTLFSGGSNGEVFAWDTRTGKMLDRYVGDADSRVISLSVNEEGTLLAAGYSSGPCFVWNISDGREVFRTHVGRKRISVDFSRHGKLAIGSAKDNQVHIADIEAEKIEFSLAIDDDLRGLEFAPDGQSLFVIAGCNCEVWDIATKEKTRSFVGHTERINDISIGPEGQRLLSAADDKSVILWDTQTGERLRTFGNYARAIDALEFRPDGVEFVTASRDNDIRLVDSHTGDDLGSLGVHFNDATAATWSPDGRYIASCGNDGCVHMWDPSGDQRLTLYGHEDQVRSVACDHTGQTIASGGRDSTIRFWDIASGLETKTIRLPNHRPPDCLCFSDDDRFVVSGHRDGSVVIADVAAGTVVRSLTSHQDSVYSIDVNQKWVATGGQDKTVVIWSLESGETRWKHSLEDPIVALDFNHDGSRLATITKAALQIWNSATGEEELKIELEDNSNFCVNFSPDSKWVAGGGVGNTITIWDANNGDRIRSFAGHRIKVNAVRFSEDGKRLLSCGSDNTIKLWNVATGEELLMLENHSDRVNDVLFAKRSIVSCSNDKTIQILPFDQPWGRARTLLGHEFEHIEVAFNADGSRLRSNSEQETLTWDTATGKQLDVEKGFTPVTEFSKKKATSPDGRWMAIPIDRTITLVDQSFSESPQESAFLTFKNLGAEQWHAQRAIEAERESDWFAVVFHR